MTTEQALEIALSHHKAGRLEEAEALYRRVLGQLPDHTDALHLLGLLAAQAGHVEAGIELIGQAIAIAPGIAAYHKSLGEAYLRAEKPGPAIAAFQQAIALAPNDAGTHNELGIALAAAGRYDEAVGAFEQAIALEPDHAQAHANLGAALNVVGRVDRALTEYRRALALAPSDAQAHSNLGSALRELGRIDEALAALRRAVELGPGLAMAHANLGIALADRGEASQAVSCLRRAVALDPHFARAHSSLVYMLMFCPDQDAQMIAEDCRRWNQAHAKPLAHTITPHPNDRTPDRRLRVGYVSPDFRAHSQAFFTVPLFAAHDRRRHEIFAYADVAAPDEITAQLRSSVDHWRDIRGFSGEQVAAMVRQDRIDILVDLTMHMAGAHLDVFARKPAPVQLCWLAYPGTTGLNAIDYRVSDPYLEPPGENDLLFAEQTVRLPHSFWCYDPLTSEPVVNALPALERGVVTFGSLNQFCKVNPGVLALWARVLGAVLDSRLLLLAPEGSHRDETRALLERRGIAPDRLVFATPCPRLQYLELYHQIDIGLDPFPYNGHTTTFDALWMGVPVVTLAGRTAVGRAGVSILSNLGLPELIAGSPEQYVTIAAALAGDRTRLRALRAGLRPRLQASPLMDGPRFAAEFEAALRQMWETWCGR
jgi:predicted O-linked N-acetylglucosamine transferase (SPINDLY family)